MKRTFAVALCLVGLILGTGPMTWADTKKEKAKPAANSKKKGVGLAESHGMTEKQLDLLHARWYYNWGASTKLHSSAEFVPMIFSLKRLDAAVSSEYVLGFNEPDHEKQSNISVRDALQNWGTVAGKARNVGSPAMAGNPVSGEWFPAFMKEKPRVDFVTVHWYKGADARHFIRDMEAVHTAYDKPLWVTEFAPQTTASSKQNPDKYKQADVDKFIVEVIDWMEKTPYIHRYAWHDAKSGTSALFDAKGDLTATGKTYASHPRVAK